MTTRKKFVNVNNPTQINIEQKENSYQTLKKDAQNFNAASAINDLGRGAFEGFKMFLRASFGPAILSAIVFIGAMALWHGQPLGMAYSGMFKLFIFILTEVIPFLFIKGFPFVIIMACVILYSRTHSRMQIVTSNYWVDIDPVDDFSSIQNQFDAVQKAMDEKRTLKIKYNSMQRRERTEREIDPYCLFYSSGVWYVLAYCHLRSEVRMFALDCIEEIKVTENYYVIPRDFSTDDYFKAGWHIYRAGKPTEIRLSFTSEVARWVLRRKWHPSQKVEKNKDGSIVFTVTVDGTAEVRRWIYHWGPNCEVISPPEFRKEVEAELEAMIKVYRK